TQAYAPAPNLGFGVVSAAGVPVFRIIYSSPGQLVCLGTNPRQDSNVQSLAISGGKSDVGTASGVAGFDARASPGSWAKAYWRIALLATSETTLCRVGRPGRIGLCQAGAEAMAEGGASFQEILPITIRTQTS